MKKIPKPLLALSIAVLVLATVLMIASLLSDKQSTTSQSAGTASSKTEAETKVITSPAADRVADIDPIEVPEDIAADIGFEPKVVDRLTERFVLRNTEIGDNSVIYYYQTHENTSGERLMLICNEMSEDDYKDSLPDINFKNVEYNDITLTYIERSLLYVPDGHVISDAVQKSIDEGLVVVEYGNTLDEMISMSSVMWYEDGIKYQLQVRNNDVTENELLQMAQSIINS